MGETRKCIKVGCLLPLSGPEHRHARSQLLAVELAFDDVRQGCDFPYDVRLVVQDDKFDPQVAAGVARAFVADEDMLAVIGPMNSFTCLEAAPVFSKAGLAHIATAASNPTLTRRGWRTFFRVVVNDVHHFKDAAQYAVSGLNARRIGVIFSAGGTFSGPMAAGFRDTARSLGADIPLFVPVDSDASDYGDVVRQTASADCELLFFVLGEETAVRISRQLRAGGVMTPFFATDGIKPFPYFATPDYPVDGPYYTNVCADPRVKPAAKAMVDRYIDRFGEEPTVYMAEAYDAARIILDALMRVDVLTRDALRDEIAATRDFAGTSGLITFDEYGDIADPEIGIYRVVGRELHFVGFTRELLSATSTRE